MNRIEQMRALLQQALAPAQVEVQDDSAQHAGHRGAAAGGGHYRVTIVAQAFDGMPLLARHRRIYEALAPMIGAQIHALSIRALAPAETAPDT